MDSKGVNPFLMDDYPAAEGDAAAAASNPFLQDFGDPGAAAAPSGADANPFLSFGSEPASYEPPAGDSTNPFAMFGAEPVASDPPTGTLVEPEATAVPEADLLGHQEATLVDTTAPVEEPQPPVAPAVTSPPQPQPEPVPVVSSQPPPKPARPAPPPRPGPPPAPPRGLAEKAKEPDPRQLVLSVTGAMDETSNQMMDRIHMTRTPSPTLMHSPSPTPEHSLAEHYDAEASGVPDLAHDEMASTPAVAEMEQSAVASDNPFSDAPVQPSPFEQSAPSSKRPSIATSSPPAAQQAAAGPFAESTPFGDDPSSYYAAEHQPAQAEAPVVGELVGGFGSEPEPHQPEAFDYAATSPAPAQEFPAASYRSDDVSGGSDSYTASTKVARGGDAFDAFASKFDQAANTAADPHYDPFGGGAGGGTAMDTSSDVWGDSTVASSDGPASGFDDADGFDSFLSMTAPPPEVAPRRRGSADSDEAPDFSVVIKPRDGDQAYIDGGPVPALGPPPKSPMTTAYADGAPRFNPFDKSGLAQEAIPPSDLPLQTEMKRSESQETPPTPLFDEDMSQPLEDFPRIHYEGEGWEMQLRMPIKKKITGQRFWKKVFVRLVHQGDTPVLQLFNNKGDKDPFQELPLLPCYSVSEIAAQQFDQYGKIFTVKLQYIVYKERPGVRPGQVTKAERITNKLSQFAAYAIQGDYQGVKEFGSDLKKLGLPVEHAPQSTQLFKLGSQNYEDMKQFSVTIEEALFRIPAHRERALTYKMEEVQISVVDELYVEQNSDGHVDRQIARVRLFFLGFLSGMHDVELGVNDIRRQGKEVVGRHDIIPMATEEWIRLENVEFHSCIEQDEWEKTKIIKFKAPDACYIELLRFRVRPPRNRELPLQLKAVMCVTGNRVELRADILVPGFASRKLGRVPCEDVSVRFPIPECWIYLFRVEKHFRYGSVKSAHRRTGKIKGIERFLGAVDTLEPQLMEVTSGQAKYEHQHHAIVWRMPRLPKEGQGAYTTHQLVCRMNLTSYDQIPEKLTEYAYVEFTMPCTQVSHTTARSCSFSDFEGDAPPEKYVRNLSRHEYRVGIEHTQGEGPGAYITATASTPKKTIPESTVEESTDHHPASDSDSSD